MSKKKLILSFIAGLGILTLGFLIFLDIQVITKFSGRKWRLPSLVYSRPLELYEGKKIDLKSMTRELVEGGYIRRRHAVEPGQFSVQQNQLQIYRREFQFWDGVESSALVSLEIQGDELASVSVDEQNTDLVRLEPLMIGGIYPHDFEDRKLIQLKDVPQHLVDALVVTEDQGFYDHYGISIRGIARAVVTNVKEGRYAQGASTLTQQLVKNFYLDSERTLKRKALEAIYSVLLELHYSKDEILETYLNEVYLGQHGQRAIHGFGLGAEFYFNKPIHELEPHESALLVAIINGPSLYNPRANPDKAKERRNKVLRMMADKEKITEDQLLSFSKMGLGVAMIPKSQSLKFPGFLDLVKRHLARDYQAEDLQQEGMRIFTSFDPQSQWAAEKAVAQQINRWGNGGKALEGAMVVASLSGDIEAIVPGKTAGFAGFNRVLDTQRPIGSLVKPAIMLTALQEPFDYHLASRLDDSKFSVTMPNGTIWEPRNYDGEDHGTILMYQALAKSYNQAFVRLGMEVGPEQVKETLLQLGAPDTVPVNPAMLLGSFGLSPLEVLGVFQTIAGDGVKKQARSIRYVVDYKGDIVQSYPVNLQRVISKELSHLLKYALQTVMYEGSGKSAYNTMNREILSAGKTGTSNEKRDSWFAGFTGDKIAVAWMGRDDNQPTPLTGSSGALQVWAQTMNQISFEPLYYEQLNGVEYVWVDEEKGGRSMELCQQVRQIPFLPGKQPDHTATCIKSVEPILDWFKNLFGG